MVIYILSNSEKKSLAQFSKIYLRIWAGLH